MFAQTDVRTDWWYHSCPTDFVGGDTKVTYGNACRRKVLPFVTSIYVILCTVNIQRCIYPKEIPKWERTNQKTWVQVDQNEDELTKMSTNWPNSEYELTKWVRIDQIDEYELTKMRTSWLEYELTWVPVDWEPFISHIIMIQF